MLTSSIYTITNPEEYEWDAKIATSVQNLKVLLNELAIAGWHVYQIDYNQRNLDRCVTVYRKKNL